MRELRPPSIPATAAESFTAASDDGVRLRVYALRANNPAAPVLLWGHATGFAAGSYLPLLEMLSESFRVFAFDLRAHGGSDVPEGPLEETLQMDRFAEDLGVVARAVAMRAGDEPLYYGAHSLSGIAALRLAAIFGNAPWTAMTLFEPPVVPSADLPEHGTAVASSRQLSALASRRRERWASPAAFFGSLEQRAPYSGFRPDMLAAHTSATLLPLPDGAFGLCCPRDVEAQIYLSALDPSTFEALHQVTMPVHYVAGEGPRGNGPPSWAVHVQGLAADRTPNGRLTVLRDTGHLMPFERPEACRDILVERSG